jgi:hypothetical protein
VAANKKIDEQIERRDRLITEQIRMGWGNTPSCLIPEDWRTRPGPEYGYRKDRDKQRLSELLKERIRNGELVKGEDGKWRKALGSNGRLTGK